MSQHANVVTKFPTRTSQSHGKFVGDIEKLRNKSALKQSRRDMDRFIDSLSVSTIWCWETDAEGRYTFFSDNFARLTGNTSAQFIGKQQLDIACPALSSAQRQTYLEKVSKHEPLIKFVVPHLNRQGELKWLSLSGKPYFSPLKSFEGYRGVGEDVTSHQRTLNASKGIIERLNATVESLEAGFLLFDAEDKLVLTNEACRRMFGGVSRSVEPGTTFEEIIRTLVSEQILDCTPSTPEEFIERWLHAHENPVGCFEISSRSGEWYRVREQLVRDGGTTLVISDITREKELEQSLHTASKAVEEAEDAKISFLSKISHELRTPLNATIGFTDIILDETFGPLNHPRYRNYIDDIRKSGTHLLKIVNDLLEVSKPDAITATLSGSAFDVREEIKAVLEEFDDEIRRSKLSFELDIDVPSSGADDAYIGSKAAFSQITKNLISNAIKFSRNGDPVMVTAMVDSERTLSLQVKDNGIGIDPSELTKILNPFHRGDDQMVRDRAGVGLGLAVCDKMCKRMGGRLEISSRPNRGTSVTARLPEIAR